jgi:hypothetical protein
MSHDHFVREICINRQSCVRRQACIPGKKVLARVEKKVVSFNMQENYLAAIFLEKKNLATRPTLNQNFASRTLWQRFFVELNEKFFEGLKCTLL